MDKNDEQKQKIINIETVSDLHKIPFNLLKSSKICNFKGKYYDQLYKEALSLEEQEANNKPKIKFVYCKTINENLDEDEIKEEINLELQKPNSLSEINIVKKKEKTNQKEIKKKIKRNSFEVNIVNEDNESFRKERNNSHHISSIKRKEFKIKKIIFQMNYDTKMGEEIGLVGSIKELGLWNQNNMIRMNWNKGNNWKAIIDTSFAEINTFEYKFVLVEGGIIKEWEGGNNRIFNKYEIENFIIKYINKNNNSNSELIDRSNYSYNFKDNTLLLKCVWKN
jgi:hypothetical protein